MTEFLLSLASPELLVGIGLVILIGGLLGEIAVLFISPGAFNKWLTVVCVALIVAGVWLERVGDDRLSELKESKIKTLDAQIEAERQERTLTLNKLAAAANERAAALNARAAATEKENLQLKLQLGVVQTQVRPRQIDEKQRHKFKNEVKGKKRPITVVRLHDAESRSYADEIARLLSDAGFDAYSEDATEPIPPDQGVIFCQKQSSDLATYEALHRSGIATRIIKLSAKRPDFCDAPGVERVLEHWIANLSGGGLTPQRVGRVIPRGTASGHVGARIFVGQKPR